MTNVCKHLYLACHFPSTGNHSTVWFQAMKLQFTTAIGAMMGTVCSLMAQGIGDAATAWILPFTAGGFIYIATVSVIPELLQDTKLGQSVKEIAALLVGVYMMVLIGQFEWFVLVRFPKRISFVLFKRKLYYLFMKVHFIIKVSWSYQTSRHLFHQSSFHLPSRKCRK